MTEGESVTSKGRASEGMIMTSEGQVIVCPTHYHSAPVLALLVQRLRSAVPRVSVNGKMGGDLDRIMAKHDYDGMVLSAPVYREKAEQVRRILADRHAVYVMPDHLTTADQIRSDGAVPI